MVRIFLAPSKSVPCPTCSEEENCDHIVLYFNGFTLADVSALALTKWTICLYFILIIYHLETLAPRVHMFPGKTSIREREKEMILRPSFIFRQSKSPLHHKRSLSI